MDQSGLPVTPRALPAEIRTGVAPWHRTAAARLYWQAFGPKLGRIMGPEALALAYLDRVIRADHVITAVSAEGRLLGIAGFRTATGGFTAGGFDDLVAIYGRIGALWRSFLLRLMAQDLENRRFLVDGIVVGEAMRGQGIGRSLIAALCAEACSRGYDEVRLDVADVNPRARALYEREGFVPVGIDRMGLLAPVLRFSSSTRMVRRVV